MKKLNKVSFSKMTTSWHYSICDNKYVDNCTFLYICNKISSPIDHNIIGKYTNYTIRNIFGIKFFSTMIRRQLYDYLLTL